MKKKNLQTKTKLSVKLTLHERDLIRSSTFLDPDFGKGGVIDGKNVTVDLSLDEIGKFGATLLPRQIIPATANSRGNLINFLTSSRPFWMSTDGTADSIT